MLPLLIAGFLFDQVSNSLNCKGISLMCPMMCRHLDASGCVTCDCNTFDPSNPGGSGSHSLPSGTHTGNGTGDPSNPAGGDPSQPGASNHYDPSHPLASGEQSLRAFYCVQCVKKRISKISLCHVSIYIFYSYVHIKNSFAFTFMLQHQQLLYPAVMSY
ncbi:hypothetical protein DPMN_022894 [Dreissena polymorpha]|uniref:Uncharacterized protein n=1 Tax=Dreissena polymorpha TaxID=45954 RepID=A0A9D4LJQ2_DREPO|nr:hypothetical protein DPMN_022894 [Dreissena polymorpha]